ncbi:nucleoside/nucleotide kinase family protein [Nocardia cyriacigeorgica]|uniref:Nucleoside/nucleotide kinase family protein n=1 Tax=Nocardia cyriacigeorgica TaxID=135487 RepID=A0A5R8NGL7_9NOCA|nr:nucleoside/nucleotide kinase family protein [Nocardia cyriacigeorgica]TLF74734.1 nucleoside/nucleotide kinase family protein [Nocardia cyriacigeorgica]
MTEELETTVDALAERVLDRAGDCADRYLLGIAGPPGAGKSTLAAALRTAVDAAAGSNVAELAPMDGYHLPNAHLRALGRLAGKGEPDTFDVTGFVDGLNRLRHTPIGEPVPWPTFDRTTDEPTPGGIIVTGQRIIITEGNYLLLDDGPWSKVRPRLDECWYLTADRRTRVERLLHRHLRGGRDESAARAKVHNSDMTNADLVESTAHRADLVLHERDSHYFIY